MKSTMRPASSMFAATVESSSDRVGEPATICWNSVSTLRCSASISSSGAAAVSARFHRGAHERLQLRVLRDLHASPGPRQRRTGSGSASGQLCAPPPASRSNRSVGCGESTRASRCATTTIVLSSPRELINCTELSRPTVNGSTAWGKNTVSRTGRTGSVRGPLPSIGFLSRLYVAGLIGHSHSLSVSSLKL